MKANNDSSRIHRGLYFAAIFCGHNQTCKNQGVSLNPRSNFPAAFLLAAFACQAAESAPSAPIVNIDTGLVKGVSNADVASFKGIPFAAAPVGSLRWRAPQPAAHWEGTRAADQYGNDCMQKPIAIDAAPLGAPPAEDCLYLNVWKPAAKASKRPVMVWIYGGGFMNGGASPSVYSGEALAKQGILVVSFNYRLGRFGFFAHPQLTQQQAGAEAIGNYGFMDQIAALQWVKRNIAAFGGDPDNVTLAGESAGGMSIHTLLTSPKSQGLFNRVVIQSGGDGNLMINDLNSAEHAGQAFARSQGIADDDPQSIEKLRTLSAVDVMGDLNMSTLFKKPEGPPTFTLPLYDGVVAIDALKAYSANTFAHVPVMIGATSDDLFGQDGAMIKGAKSVADLLSSKGVPVYRYRYSYTAEATQAQFPLGAKHAGEIPYFFKTLKARYGDNVTARDEKASRLASGYLVNFVKTGNPNGHDLVKWPRYETAGLSILDFKGDGTAALIKN